MLDKTAVRGALGEVLGHRDGYIVKNKHLREKEKKTLVKAAKSDGFIIKLISFDLKITIWELTRGMVNVSASYVHDREDRQKGPAQLY